MNSNVKISKLVFQLVHIILLCITGVGGGVKFIPSPLKSNPTPILSIERIHMIVKYSGIHTGPVHKGTNHVQKAVSDRDPLPDKQTANAVPITNRICALRDNFVPTAQSVLIDPCMASMRISKMHTYESRSERALRSQSSESGFLRESRSKTRILSSFKTFFKSLI